MVPEEQTYYKSQSYQSFFSYIYCQTDKVDVRVGGLDGTKQGVLLAFLNLLVPEEPEDLWSRKGLDLTFQMQFLTLLSAGGLPEEGRFDASLLRSILVLHGEPYMIGLFPVFVTDNDLVVTSIVIGQMSKSEDTVVYLPDN